MGAPESGMQAAEQATAEELLTSLRTIKDAERAKHGQVLDYWLSIRGDKEFPPLHDLDPLEISDAGPCSILLELIGGGQDAEIRHLGDDLKAEVTVDRIIDAPNPSILSCIAKKLPIVAISRDFLAFEDSYDSGGGWTRLWVTLLPLSSCGSWVDYVYAFVSVETGGGKAAKAPEPKRAVEPVEAPREEATAEELVADEVEAVAEVPTDDSETTEETVAEEAEIAPETPVEEPEAAEDVVSLAAMEPEVAPVDSVELVEAVEPVEVAEPVEAIDPAEVVESVESIEAVDASPEPEPESEPEPEALAESPEPTSSPGFSKLLEGIAHLTGFYGQGVKVEDPVVQSELSPGEPPAGEPELVEPEVVEPEAIEPEAAETPLELEEPAPAHEPAVEPAAPESEECEQTVDELPDEVVAEEAAPEPEPQPAPAMEGSLQSKLTEVRALADEARQAALRATAALHEGVSAAYDFALDAETSPEEYLRLVEAQGLKIQLRAPMAPVAKLAFDGLVDAATLADADKLLAWALKVELPRGGLLARIDKAGGVSELLREIARAD